MIIVIVINIVIESLDFKGISIYLFELLPFPFPETLALTFFLRSIHNITYH